MTNYNWHHTDNVSVHHMFSRILKLNTSYLTDSYIGFTLKMESVSINTIFGLKIMVKSGLEKFIFEIPPCGKIVIFITEFVILGTFMK